MSVRINNRPYPLGQLDAPATALTTLYTVPKRTWTANIRVIVCNRTAGTLSFRVALQLSGSAIDLKQYLYYDTPIIANDTFESYFEMGLHADDVISIYASGLGLTFTLIGTENDV